MLESGKTPLSRTKRIEEKLNVGEIYVKLEGVNPTGHKVDRIVEVLVKRAKDRGYSEIYAQGSQAFMTSMAYFTEKLGLSLKEVDLKNYPSLEKMEADHEDDFLAVEGHTNKQMSQMILESLDQEIINRLGYDIHTIFSQFAYGYTVTSSFKTFLKQWMQGDMTVFPRIIAASSGQERTRASSDLADEVDQALAECKGEKLSVSQEELHEAKDLLEREGVQLPNPEAATAFAAFIQAARAGKLENGKHVIVLNQGRSQLEIDQVQGTAEKDQILAYTEDWLQEYGDPEIEMREAIDNAFDHGHILLARRDGQAQGICILIDSGFDHFFPVYHLAYVGTDSATKGRGIGTELIKRAIDISQGNISLHVDLDNQRAQKLYEKLGFRHVYNRMMYKEIK